MLMILICCAGLITAVFSLNQPEPASEETAVLPSETQLTEIPVKSTKVKPTETKPIPTTEPPTTEPPESVLLEDVPYYSQESVLPTGCEIVSAKMLLEYYTKTEIDTKKLISLLNCQYPQEENGETYAPHPENAFIGNPQDKSSFGCFAPIIVKAMNHMLPENYQAIETTGTELRELAETYLPQEKPVLVWATILMWKPFPNVGWYLYDESGNPTSVWYDWPANEHCMVLVGYDEDCYYFNDPYGSDGLISFDRELTEQRYAEIGKYSAVVIEKESENPERKNPHA